jgi:hypothetical protein
MSWSSALRPNARRSFAGRVTTPRLVSVRASS